MFLLKLLTIIYIIAILLCWEGYCLKKSGRYDDFKKDNKICILAILDKFSQIYMKSSTKELLILWISVFIGYSVLNLRLSVINCLLGVYWVIVIINVLYKTLIKK